MFESRSSKYLYLPSQILSHSWLTSLSRQYTIQIWRPKFTATDRQPPHCRRTTPQPRPQGLLVFQIRRRGGTAESRDRFLQGYQHKMEKQTLIPPELKDEAAQKPKRAIFSPLICGKGRGCKFSIYFVLGWSSPRRFGANFGARREKKTKESLPLRLWKVNSPSNREEKSLRHVAMIAKFLDDNKTKTPLKKWIRTVSKFIDLIQSVSFNL